MDKLKMDAFYYKFDEGRLKYLERKQKFLETAQLACEKRLNNNRLMIEGKKLAMEQYRMEKEKSEKLYGSDSIKINNVQATSFNSKCCIS